MADYDPFDRGAPARRREDRATAEREEKTQEALDLTVVMSEPAGRRVVQRLLEKAGVFRMSFVEDNPHKTSFNEGSRNLGNWLLAQLMADTPDQYAALLKEQNDAR